MPKTVRVNLEVPPGISDQARENAERQAYQAAVFALWQEQQMTIREAAEELGLTYREFLDLLAARGISVERGPLDLQALEEARQKLTAGPP